MVSNALNALEQHAIDNKRLNAMEEERMDDRMNDRDQKSPEKTRDKVRRGGTL